MALVHSHVYATGGRRLTMVALGRRCGDCEESEGSEEGEDEVSGTA
jgi:hypothetical protein